jgi:hypothetical protein
MRREHGNNCEKASTWVSKFLLEFKQNLPIYTSGHVLWVSKIGFFLQYGKILHDGIQITFWKDRWTGFNALRDRYPILYNIAWNKNQTVATVLEDNVI